KMLAFAAHTSYKKRSNKVLSYVVIFCHMSMFLASHNYVVYEIILGLFNGLFCFLKNRFYVSIIKHLICVLFLLVGPLRVEFSDPVTLDLVRSENPVLQPGGRFKPTECIAQQKVAIIIPFRHRDEHLKYWLYYLHPILQRQQLDYGIYVINQDGEDTFNRAKLLNIGYAEALKEYDYDCFVFSDVDLIPMDDRNFYKCYNQPRHLSVSMDKFGFRYFWSLIYIINRKQLF
uniref:Beta-1,4-galactosyltransferase 1-like n=1 Tax=Sinocyclocheilus grahami TaxID=75366 RepID=A0A672QD58_SINGR